MPDIFHTPVHGQKGAYNSAAHESLRATVRCLIANFGKEDGKRRGNELLRFMGVQYGSDLSPEGAWLCRKVLERQLPLRGDF